MADPAHRATLAVGVGAASAAFAALAIDAEGAARWLLMIAAGVFGVIAVTSVVIAWLQQRAYRKAVRNAPILDLIREGESFLAGIGIHDSGHSLAPKQRYWVSEWSMRCAAVSGTVFDPQETPGGVGQTTLFIIARLDSLRARLDED